jgi:hypothetical protein
MSKYLANSTKEVMDLKQTYLSNLRPYIGQAFEKGIPL